uniref:Trichohyalin n=1 Tax=Phallusia mammillata TaxID=59560 RepID=A0A6F9D9C8_9ASCI|nr:trichohyalin [Phallusia mammillata]
MPRRTPIIPGPTGSRRLLRALHTEMKEKKLIQEQKVAPYPDSGVHSNSSSDVSDEPNDSGTLRRKSKHQHLFTMPENAIEAQQAESSTCTDSDGSDAEIESRNDDRTSSDDDVTVGSNFHNPRRGVWNGQQGRGVRPGDNRKNHGKSRDVKLNEGPAYLRKRSDENHKMKKRTEDIVLSEKDKLEIREGYQKFVLNGEQMTGTSFSSRPSAFTRVQKPLGTKSEESDSADELQFPFEEAAIGNGEIMGVREAKRLEKETKQKTKSRKNGVAEAKLLVSEAKLSEFAAKLSARQARIDERHAKMCRRRAVLKSAEERLQALEARLDADEEEHRDRERRVKNRERRVRQEEAGLQIKESSLKKREVAVTETIKDIERRRKLVEEKEEMLGAMEDIMKKREVLHRGEDKSKVGRAVGSLGKKILRSNKQSNHVNESTNHNEERHEAEDHTKITRTREDRMSTGSYKQTAPIPTPRKSIEKRPDTRGRSTSLNSDGEDDIKSQRKPVLATGSLPRYRGQKAVMGLWL